MAMFIIPTILRNSTDILTQKGHVWSMNSDNHHVICYMYPRSGSINLFSIVRVKCYARMKNIIHKLNSKMK